jgi:glutathione S-transferase
VALIIRWCTELKGPQVPFIVRPLTRAIAGQVDRQFLNQEFTKQFTFLEGQLETVSGDYLCGPNLTGADIMMIYPLQGALEGKILDRAKYPKVVAYVERLEQLEPWKRAVKIVEERTGEKFSIAPGMNN